jgi:small subunit ribosomal protein S1
MQLTMTKDKLENQETNEAEELNKFEQLLDDYQYVQPKRGQILEGEIRAIEEDNIILDVGLKRDAIVISREVKNLDEGEYEDLSIGEVIPVQVTKTPIGDENLLVSIEKAHEYQSWQDAKTMMEEDESVELEVIDHNRGGLIVQYNQLKGFVPNSHIPAIKNIRNPRKNKKQKTNMIGERLLVKPIEVDLNNQRLVFSELAAQKERRQQRLREIRAGEVITGKIVNLVDFGVFVDLGGVDGLIHISELDYQRVDHPSELVDIGEEVKVLILDVDRERERIKLSRKSLQKNPWEKVDESYNPGELVEVEITNMVGFGAFAELPEGVQGLIHVSEIGYTAPSDSESLVQPGETVLVKILNIDKERERISLSMRQVPMEKQIDWMLEAEDFEEIDSDEENVEKEISEESAEEIDSEGTAEEAEDEGTQLVEDIKEKEI